jgi:neurotransmitter:Na+ symporter, NSS family
MQERERWLGRKTFIMAAIGSAIGLGNLWRFPYVAAKYGGGAFLIPYLVALLTAGIPIMIIEYWLGVRFQSSANVALGSIRRPFRVIGWVAILGAMAINTLYCVILAWVWRYMYDSFTLTEWAGTIDAASDHFTMDVVGKTKDAGEVGGFQWPLLVGLALTWLIIWAIIRGGLGKVGKVLLFTVPLPMILVLILVVRGLTLPDAAAGLNFYLTPDWEALKNPAVWLAAYGQIFFSLSLGFGTMIVYASFMPRNSEIPNTAAITSFANCAFSFLAGFAVFSVLGFFAMAANTPVDEVVKAGPGLAFVVYPTALAQLPFAVEAFSFIFFLALMLLGIDSAFSLLETSATGIADKFGLTRERATTIVAVISFLLGVPFVTGGGFHWFDITMHYTYDYLPAFIAFCECIIIAYFFGIRRFRDEVNQHAEINVGWTFTALVTVVTPVMLGWVIYATLKAELTADKPYGGHPMWANIWLGMVVVGVLFAVAVVLSLIRTRRPSEDAQSAE